MAPLTVYPLPDDACLAACLALATLAEQQGTYCAPLLSLSSFPSCAIFTPPSLFFCVLYVS